MEDSAAAVSTKSTTTLFAGYSQDSGIDSVSEETLHNDESEVELGALELFQCLSGYVSGFCSALFIFGSHLESILVLSFLKQ